MSRTFDRTLFIGLTGKLARTQFHADTLRAHVLKPTRGSFPVDIDPKNVELIVTGRDLAIPAGWPLELGDAVHNLRSALDHLVWALILTEGRVQPNKRTQFPVFEDDTADGWTNPRRTAQRTLAAIHPIHGRVIKGIQPYTWKSRGKDPALHPLARLSRLDNDDKHRTITTLLANPVVTAFDIRGLRDCRVTGLSRNLNVPLDRSTAMGRCEVAVTGPHPQVQVETEFTSHIALEDRTDALEFLAEAARFVVNDVLAPMGINVKTAPNDLWG
jgi:hypothetical protein